VLLCSAVANKGIKELADQLERMAQEQAATDHFHRKRARQDLDWMRTTIEEALLRDLEADADVRARRADLERELAAGRIDPFRAADELVALFRRASGPPPADRG
jgi:LAO/AO transport system kinase